MILAELKAYLAQQQRVSLCSLTARFHADETALRAMLERLEHKGVVRRLSIGQLACPSGCRQCLPKTIEVYEYIHKSTDLNLSL